MTDVGFMQGQSDNLPRVDVFMMTTYFADNPNFVSAEIRGTKARRSGRQSYGDNAIGNVQVKRKGDLCTVKAKITPEHSVRKKSYSVILTCNESEGVITAVQCEDCAAHLGGCKHAIAFVAWMHRRSEDPPTTSVKCYWKKSKLSCVGTSLKFIKSKQLGKSQIASLSPGHGIFLASVVAYSHELGHLDNQLTKYYKEVGDTENRLSLHYLLDLFFSSDQTKTAMSFISFASENMSNEMCYSAFKATSDQTSCPLWFELRYARITASKAYDVAHCKTLEGTLVENILGASKLKDTVAMKRGRSLEMSVVKEVEKVMNIKINKCGILLDPNYPVIGASPDGESATFTVEIKCPTSEKAAERYISKQNKITAKYMVQVQMQMHFCNKKQALFCVAQPNFETSKTVRILVIHYDFQYCKSLLEKCTEFWSQTVFSILKKNFE